MAGVGGAGLDVGHRHRVGEQLADQLTISSNASSVGETGLASPRSTTVTCTPSSAITRPRWASTSSTVSPGSTRTLTPAVADVAITLCAGVPCERGDRERRARHGCGLGPGERRGPG